MVNLDDSAEIIAQMALPGNEDFRIVRNAAEAKSALSMRRGTGKNRRVIWYSFRTRSVTDRWDINVKAGNTLHLTVYSGLPFLHVQSGHVTIEFRSSWGNSVTVHEGASAHVIVPSAATKVTINVEPGGSYTMDIPEGKNRVYYPEKYPPLGLAAEAIAHENAMQAAMAKAHERTGSVVLSERTTPEGVVIQTIPATELTDEDFN